MHAEHVAGFRPFHHDRAGGRVHMRKIEPGFRLPILGHLPLKQSQVSTVSEQGAVTVATGSETPKL